MAKLYNKNQMVKCKDCGKLTHSSVQGVIGAELCGDCLQQAGLENEHNDGGHKTAAVEGCPICAEAFIAAHLEKGIIDKLPEIGVLPRSNLKLRSKAQEGAQKAAKTAAEKRTLPLPLGKGEAVVLTPEEVLKTIEKQVFAPDLTEELTESVRQATVRDSGSGTKLTEKKEDIQMAARKKAAKTAKKTTAKREKKEKTVTTAAPIGRERKLLLRLSGDEYERLQARAAKEGTSMANWIRTQSIG